VRYGNVWLLLLSLCFSTIVSAQQEDAPLGDVARRARMTRPSQPRATMLATNDDEEVALPHDPEMLITNACALLAVDDAERILGVPVPADPHLESDPRGGSACSYAASWGDGISVEADHTCLKVNQSCGAHDRSPACVVPSQSCGRFKLTVHSALVSENGHDMWREHIDHSPVTVPLAGIGDEADRVPGVKGLNLREGPYFLTVVVGYEPLNRAVSPADQAVELDKEIEIARKIVVRLSTSAPESSTGLADAAAQSGSPSGHAPDEESIRKQRQACADLADVVYKEKFDALKEADAPAEAFDELAKQHQEAVRQCQTEVQNQTATSAPDM
jgi:hypothetical protein